MARVSLRPRSGFSQLLHLGLLLLLPLLLYVLIRINFVPLAVALIILSKWRMFAVRPRYWLANIRANSVDVMVGISTVVFMASTSVPAWQITWAVVYGLWLIAIKPGSTVMFVSAQAMAGQLMALMALFLIWGHSPLVILVFMAWLICYLCARHFLTSFDEPHTPLFAHTWGYFGAALVWVLGHWLLFYGQLAQPTLLLTVTGYGMAALYYLEQTDRLSIMWRRQFIVMMAAIIVVVLTFSDWGDKAL